MLLRVHLLLQFEPQDAGARTYLSTDDGCFGRFHYEKQGYGSAQLYKDKTFHKDSKGGLYFVYLIRAEIF